MSVQLFIQLTQRIVGDDGYRYLFSLLSGVTFTVIQPDPRLSPARLGGKERAQGGGKEGERKEEERRERKKKKEEREKERRGRRELRITLQHLPLLIISVIVNLLCILFLCHICMVDRVIVDNGTELDIIRREVRNSIIF